MQQHLTQFRSGYGTLHQSSTTTNACTPICKNKDEKNSAAILAIKTSAGDALEVNLWNPLHTGEKAPTQGLADATKSPKRVLVAPQKGLVSSKKL